MDNFVTRRDGALPVETRQAGSVPGPLPRRGPPSTTVCGHQMPKKAMLRQKRKKEHTSLRKKSQEN